VCLPGGGIPGKKKLMYALLYTWPIDVKRGSIERFHTRHIGKAGKGMIADRKKSHSSSKATTILSFTRRRYSVETKSNGEKKKLSHEKILLRILFNYEKYSVYKRIRL
jgi:hypothetical protein